MLRVLFVESGMTGGGSFESLLQHMKALDRSRIEPHTVFLNRTKYCDLFAAAGLPFHLVRDPLFDRGVNERHPGLVRAAGGALRVAQGVLPPLAAGLEGLAHAGAVRALTDLIRSQHIDLVHTNNQPNRDFYALLAARAAGRPCVAHLRSFFSKGFVPAKQRFAAAHVACFVAYSPGMADHWADQGLPRDKIRVVPNAIAQEPVEPCAVRARYGIPAGSPVIGIVGKIIPVRGHACLLRAVAALDPALDARLLVVGGGDSAQTGAVTRLARDLGLAGRVVMAGPAPDAKPIIAGLDILALPYSIEPFGRVLLEAMSLGVPTVVSDLGHIREMTGGGAASVLFPAGDHRALAAALEGVFTRPEERAARIEAARRLVRERYSMEAYVRDLDGIYTQAAKRGAP